MAVTIIKYFQGPSYTADLWSDRNPYLRTGEIGNLIEGGKVTRQKVGPGYWNDLGFQENLYDSNDLPTNPLLTLSGTQAGRKLQDIIHDIITPYVAPSLSNLKINIGGGPLTEIIKEIGQSISGPVSVTLDIADPGGLSGSTPINISAGGVFSNEGSFANSFPINLTLGSPLAPSTVTTVTITVNATHNQGISNSVTVQIKFYPKLIWVSNSLATISDGPSFMALSGKSTILAPDYKKDFGFTGNGYSWIAIPAMYGITNPKFTDVTNPNAPLNYSMEDMGTLLINNGVGNYNYQMFRSTYLLINATTLRVS